MSMLDQQPRHEPGPLHRENSHRDGAIQPRPRRILHVVPAMDRGGIETWLMHILRHIDRSRYRMDFLTLLAQAGAYDDEIRALGSQVLICPASRRPWQFIRRLTGILRNREPYDVIHSHVHHYSGVIVALAAAQGIPTKIVHSHNDTRPHEAGRGWPRKLYLRAMKHLIRRYATHRMAVSCQAAEDLFGLNWASERNCQVAYCGMDFSPFAVKRNRLELCDDLGLPADALVIGHVGRFFWRKNHAFLLEIAAEAFAREPRARLLCIGDGPLLPEIDDKAKAMGIRERILFAGARTDVPLLMTSVMDVFVLPSHHEGLSLASLEAQAAGLQCLLSEGLTKEGDMLPRLVSRLPLSASAAEWASVLLDLAGQPRISSEQALAVVNQSDFAVSKSLERLLHVYDIMA